MGVRTRVLLAYNDGITEDRVARLGFELWTAEPCSESWEAMHGGARERHCAACEKDVHNVAAMTPREVVALRSAMGEVVCARLTRRADELVMIGVRSGQPSSIAAGIAFAVTMSIGSAAAQAQANDLATKAVLVGRLIDADGTPKGGAVVFLYGSGRSQLAVSGPDGRFEFHTSPGVYDITPSGPYVKVKGAALHEGMQDIGQLRYNAESTVVTLGEVVSVPVGARYWIKHPVRFVRFLRYKVKQSFSS